MLVGVRCRKTLQNPETGTLSGEIAVSKKFFEVALDDGYVSIKITICGFLNNGAIFAQVFMIRSRILVLAFRNMHTK